MKENPQDLSKGTSDDSSSLVGEAQKDIHPLYCIYIQREIKMPPFLTEEEIYQLINIQSTSLDFSPNLNYHIAVNRFKDQFKEKKI